MKRLIFAVIISFLALVPRASFAASAPTSCSNATLNEYYCTCSLSTTSTPVYVTATSEATCDSACGAVSNAVAWTLEQCTIGSSGSLSVKRINTSTVGSSTQAAAALTELAPEEKADPIYPDLNVDIPGLDPSTDFVVSSEDSKTGSNFIGVYITKVYSWLIGAGALIAVSMMMIGGLQYALARGKASYIDKAKHRISNAITGLILLLAAYNIAFLINPELVVFNSLAVPYVKGLEYFPPDGEDTDVVSNATLNGVTVPLKGDHITATSATLDAETLTALQTAADAFYNENKKNIVITSATRNLTKQATLFYTNCIKTGGSCSVPTCNPASSSVVSKSGSRYTLVGALAGKTNASEIVSGMTTSASYGNCPHTSGIAIDAWCDDGGSNYAHDPSCQEKLIKTMINAGFCRLGSEVWHFELNSKKVSSNCLQSNNSISYTTKAGKTYTPTSQCSKWDFKNHTCNRCASALDTSCN
ncbi:MAG: hypothetical protein UY72_C0008G0006 [Candidatus Uhrbacteria bacterium GW2011_GWD2_52_7]|uniref:Peptidase M15B domain-containing protein n=1 Tax=Candidatus Uhrbacteria bacterium GW2011_GWD2_52_7 TaxID=1618989 RepID=A0A0G1XH28_9BACT|nr:MAG: hypothetical protein UY72_C0008G0006 [Candidatus Uhrbacteria bacterium GW2011_GWD2_52_7]